jgi:hypothetical protein
MAKTRTTEFDSDLVITLSLRLVLDTVTVIEFSKMRWVKHVVLMMKSNVLKMLIGKTEKETRHRREVNVKTFCI